MTQLFASKVFRSLSAGAMCLALAAFAAPSLIARAQSRASTKPTIVLVHGAWADGSSWNGEVTRLQRDGYTVVAPPNTLRGVQADASYLASFFEDDPRSDRAGRALLRRNRNEYRCSRKPAK